MCGGMAGEGGTALLLRPGQTLCSSVLHLRWRYARTCTCVFVGQRDSYCASLPKGYLRVRNTGLGRPPRVRSTSAPAERGPAPRTSCSLGQAGRCVRPDDTALVSDAAACGPSGTTAVLPSLAQQIHDNHWRPLWWDGACQGHELRTAAEKPGKLIRKLWGAQRALRQAPALHGGSPSSTVCRGVGGGSYTT